ncbi:MAG: T9SS type A sorting domain-containing protein [Bacteroidetes bacterium]|nr:T9SS type A sorting domain-containing protein [Bacteroidota bacterium]
MKKHLFILLFSVISVFASAQTNKITKKACGTGDPGAEWNEWFNKKVEEFKKNNSAQKNQNANYTIPVIFHVIHGGQGVGSYPNISQAQINSQITILNNDFAGTGLNVGNVSSTAFSSLVSNCNVNFCLAQKNPSGATLAEPGIERINYTTNSWANPTSFTTITNFRNYIENTIKPNTIWDPTRYLNMWLTDVDGAVGLLGYATFPPSTGLSGLTSGLGTTTTDGVWCWSRSIGDIGSLSPPYNKGRTATHEIGHWLGLRHIWGDASCGNDFCNDTPAQQQENVGCPGYPHVTCSNGPDGDMFMNFMDYSDDACMYMFTPDQRDRVQTAMSNCPFRTQLTASSATLCGGGPVACSYTVSNFTNTDTLANPLGLRRASAIASETFCPQGAGKAGYISGTNCYGDLEKAEFISASKYASATNPVISGVVVLFFNYIGVGTDGNSNVDMKIYNGSSAASAPGSLIGSTTSNLSTIAATTNTTSVSYCGNPGLAFGVPVIMPYKFIFSSPVNAPTSGGFFASVTLPNIPGDTVVVFDKMTGSSNTGWEKWSDNSWHDMKTAWGGTRNFNLAILPIIDCATGVRENSVLNNAVSLFPNPSNGNFNVITTFATSQNIVITVYNMLGQNVYSNKLNNVSQTIHEVDLKNQAGGVYLVEVKSGTEKVVKRMILNK